MESFLQTFRPFLQHIRSFVEPCDPQEVAGLGLVGGVGGGGTRLPGLPVHAGPAPHHLFLPYTPQNQHPRHLPGLMLQSTRSAVFLYTTLTIHLFDFIILLWNQF